MNQKVQSSLVIVTVTVMGLVNCHIAMRCCSKRMTKLQRHTHDTTQLTQLLKQTPHNSATTFWLNRRSSSDPEVETWF